jgi:hypothetical protein
MWDLSKQQKDLMKQEDLNLSPMLFGGSDKASWKLLLIKGE